MIGGNIGFTAGTLLLVAGLVLIIVSSLRPNRIQATSDSLVITGSYKYSVKLDEIRSVERLDSLPKIKLRTNGIGWPNIKIGHFRVEGIGKCRLYVNQKFPPYVHIVTSAGEHIIFNTKDPENTESIFRSLSAAVSSCSVSADTPCVGTTGE